MQAIVAVDNNWGIGYRGQLLAHIPADMRFFKQATMGKIVVMGKETFLSLPGGKPLSGRVNIILCEDRHFSDQDIIVCVNLGELWEELSNHPQQEIFVIGGANVYAQLLPFCQGALVTKINAEFPADRYFPELDEMPEWEMVEEGPAQFYGELGFRFTRYVNRNCGIHGNKI